MRQIKALRKSFYRTRIAQRVKEDLEVTETDMLLFMNILLVILDAMREDQ
jgi:hypothetical protein